MSYQDIHPADLDDLLRMEGLTIIDQRDANTRSRGQLSGAQPSSDELIGRPAQSRRQDPAILVYCYHGNQSRDLTTRSGSPASTAIPGWSPS